MKLEKQILDELRLIRAGEYVRDTINICPSGRKCHLRHYILLNKKGVSTCKSAVPCNDATAHRVVIYKEIK